MTDTRRGRIILVEVKTANFDFLPGLHVTLK